MRLFISFLLLMFCFAGTAKDAQAQDCTGPEHIGIIIHNKSFDVFQGCTSDGWYSFHPPVCPDGDGADPCGSCYSSLAPGTICADDTIYAGTTVGGVPMYAARCDHGQSWDGAACTGAGIARQWKTTNTTTAGTTSLTDGVVNTDAMATAGLALHPAAEACRSLGAEWYLPAQDELDLLYDNLVDQDGNNTPGGPLGSTFDFNITGSYPAGWYWSSVTTRGPRDSVTATRASSLRTLVSPSAVSGDNPSEAQDESFVHLIISCPREAGPILRLSVWT